ncbi:TlpA family protein disulfide reductase [Flavobacterium sp. GT2N3]|uniref:TlpA family protein disulfide reductase n=1 Tax=unclassified Flavobacterium TaxID=196869 RepID=UPI003AB0A08D
MLSNYQWQLKDATGKALSLDAYKGKIVFINFWVTWFPPCIAEMQAFKNYMLIIKTNLTLPVYQSVTNPLLEMESATIPETYLIDQSGNIIGTVNWNSDLFQEMLDIIKKIKSLSFFTFFFLCDKSNITTHL